MKNHTVAVIALLLACFMSQAGAADKMYKDGNVTAVSFVRTKPGKFDEYMAYLATTYKVMREEEKKAGLIVGYTVYAASPHSPNDADVILTTVYKNMAAFDRTDDFDALATKVMGSSAVRDQKAIDRESMRSLLGSDLMREMILK